MIISSSLGYFFFAGLQTFALLFVRGHYHASQASAELVLALLVLGALVGTLVSGRITDAMVRAGHLEARVWVPAMCYFGAAALLIPGSEGPPDPGAVVRRRRRGADFGRQPAARRRPAGHHARRVVGARREHPDRLRSLAQALAPLVFGGLSQLIAGIAPAQAPVGTHTGVISPSTARGLEISFLLMVTLAAAGVFLLKARSRTPRDVATAAASNQGSPDPPDVREPIQEGEGSAPAAG